MDLDIQQLEIYCKQLYESQDATIRAEAEKFLVSFQDSPNALQRCQSLLDRGDSSYSQVLAATTLTKLISKNVHGLHYVQQRLDIRNYVLNYLATRINLEKYVLQSLITLLVRITKYGWFDTQKNEFVFRTIVEDVSQFLHGSSEHGVIGVQILSQLTNEMNLTSDLESILSVTKHRKIACSFRDSKLLDIFLLACTLLGRARDTSNLNELDDTKQRLMNQILLLAKHCLSFDFIGTNCDESIDDMSTLQIPTNWRPAFLDFSTLNLFFELYRKLPIRLASTAIYCITQMTSVRRSIFCNLERIKYLNHLFTGIRNILEDSQRLSDPDNYHEFCRLLARLKSNFQLGELLLVDTYQEVIELIAKFTVQSLRVWSFSANSLHYLLSLWQRMVTSVPYLKGLESHNLDRYTPVIMEAFVTSRMEAVTQIIRDGLEDPFDDLGTVYQQLEQLSIIGRCDYEKTCTILIQLFDQTAGSFHEVLRTQATNSIEISIHESQLTWLVYIIGASIGGRLVFTSNDDNDLMDGELVCRVLQLISLTDSRLPQIGCEKLELAFLSVLENLRRIYVIDQPPKIKLFKRLSETLGIQDEQNLLSVLNRKILTNMKFWGTSEMVIGKSLGLLGELSNSYNNVRKLLKLDEVHFLLNNHTVEHFSFLGPNHSISEMRNRTIFYTALGRLLMVDLGEDEEQFLTFMTPLTNTFESIGSMLIGNCYHNDDAKKALIGVARDLRGFTNAISNKTAFTMFFDWIFPDYTPILLRAIEIWAHDESVTTPILKFYCELVHNRSLRLQFDVSSPNGILLFREVSKIICAYGARIITLEVPLKQVYKLKLKGFSVCFITLKTVLCGNYVNFGVFKLYRDDSLDDVLNMATKFMISIPQNELLDYPKLALSYYLLVECLSQDHIFFLSKVQPDVFLYMLKSIANGIMSPDIGISAGCCNILDNLVSFIFKELALKNSTFRAKKLRRSMVPDVDLFVQVLETHPEILQGTLVNLLNVVMFDENKQQWQMSRPLLCVILLCEDYFRSLKSSIAQSQPTVQKQEAMAQLFETLMDGIERNLTVKNRDKFTQNLLDFRRDVQETLKSSGIVSSVSSLSEMICT